MQLFIDLVTAAYDYDAFRFGLWGIFDTIGVSDTLISIINGFGFTIFEDYSIVGGR